MDGIAWSLVRRWHRNVSMNDFDFSSAGLSASAQGSLKTNLENLKRELYQEFFEAATDLKVNANLDNAWGNIG